MRTHQNLHNRPQRKISVAAIVAKQYARVNPVSSEVYIKQLQANDSRLLEVDFADEESLDLQALCAALLNNTVLRKLDLAYSNIALPELLCLAQNQSITILGLDNCKLRDESAALLKTMHNLRELNVSDNKLTNQAAITLSQHSTLTKLDLSSNRIDDAGVIALAGHPTLTALELTACDVTFKGAQALQQSLTLKQLDLSQNYLLGSAGVAALLNHPSLTQLTVAQVDADKTLASYPIINSCLLKLTIKVNEIVDEGVRAFLSLTQLIELEASLCHIGPEGAKLLATHPRLQRLGLDNNQLGDEGAQALLANAKLHSLSMNWNKLTNKPLVALKDNPSLLTLSIQSNQLDSAGAHLLASSASLTQLDVSFNNMDDVGARAFLQNTTLVSLDLACNKIEKPLEMEVEQHIAQNKQRLLQARDNYIRFIWLFAKAKKNVQAEGTFTALPHELFFHLLSFLQFSYLGKTYEQGLACANFILTNFPEIELALQDAQVSDVKIKEEGKDYTNPLADRFSLFKVLKPTLIQEEGSGPAHKKFRYSYDS